MKDTITHRILRRVEPLVFGRRPLTLALLLGITLGFAALAAHTRISAGYEKTIPLQHEYMKVFKEYYADFGGANTVIVALMQNEAHGEIYNEEFLSRLKQVTDEVFFLPGVDRPKVMSIFTPNVNYVEVIEGGLSGSTVVPADYQPNPEMFAKIKDNVSKANVIGRLVAENQRGALVVAELIDHDPLTGKPLDYNAVAQQLEQIRHKYETADIKVEIIGFAKVVGDITDASIEVGGFFIVALLLTSILLWIYVGSLKLAMLPMACALVSVVWEFGLLYLAGFGLDPFAILVPFLVLAVSVSHGVQYVNCWADEVATGKSSFDASVATFRSLAIAGTIAILADAAGVATILLVPIETIREMALNAVFGVTAIIITNKVLMPILLSYVRIGDTAAFAASHRRRNAFGDSLWRKLAKITRRKQAWAVVGCALLALSWSVWMYPKLQIGDALEGVPELRPQSRYNQDARDIAGNFSIGNDIFKVIAEGAPNACIDYQVMHKIDKFAWQMENTSGVQGVLSLITYAKLVYAGLNEGRLNAETLPRNHFALAQTTALVPSTSGLLNKDCSAMAVFLFTQNHRAQTISSIVAEVKRFQLANPSESVKFRLATGNVGVMAATNEVVKQKELVTVFWVYAVIILFLWLSFRTLSGLLCVVLPLALVSMLGYGVMTLLDIGVKVSTLPVVSLAVGIGVDYGIYIYSILADGLRRGQPLEEAYYQTLRSTGKSVIFIGLALGITVSTWMMSKLQFQADMGLLLVFLFTANMLGAILLLPALAYFFSGEELRHRGEMISGGSHATGGAAQEPAAQVAST